jgi:hypothetical protein
VNKHLEGRLSFVGVFNANAGDQSGQQSRQPANRLWFDGGRSRAFLEPVAPGDGVPAF